MDYKSATFDGALRAKCCGMCCGAFRFYAIAGIYLLFIGRIKTVCGELRHRATRSVSVNSPRGDIMPRPRPHDATLATAFLSGHPRTRRYFVGRRQDVWFIRFDGEEFGPYKTEREAMLFAIDAAHKLGVQGEATEVLLVDENDEAKPAWSYGESPFPSWI
jgi:hypothetical protein